MKSLKKIVNSWSWIRGFKLALGLCFVINAFYDDQAAVISALAGAFLLYGAIFNTGCGNACAEPPSEDYP